MEISLLLWISSFFCYYWACLNVSQAAGHSVDCLDHQKFLLLELKKHLEFDPTGFNKLVFWNESVPCREWRGVSWDEEGHVVSLDLSEEFISGGLDKSSTLFSLQYLKHLNLAHNDFSTVIPSRIKELRGLSSLNLSYAGVLEEIPMEIAQLTRLAILDLSFLDVPALPNMVKLVQNLSEVRELYLDGIDIGLKGNEWGPTLLSFLPHLHVLSMSYCNLSGPFDSSLEILQNLSIINLSGNLFSGGVPDFFAQFSNLTEITYLDLSYNFFTGSIPSSSMSNLTKLTYLDLSYNFFTGPIPSSLFSLPLLQSIVLSNNSFQGQLDAISNVSSPMLQFLDLRSNYLEGPFPQFIFHHKGLETLRLSWNKFSGTIRLDMFVRLQNLRTLDLSNNNLSVDANVKNATRLSFPNMTSLKLASCKLRQFPGFLRNQSTLVELDLSDNEIEDKIPHWIWYNRDLLELNLSHNFLHNRERILYKFSYFRQLYLLDLHYNFLEGSLPGFPTWARFLDYSYNKFSSVISPDIGNYLSRTIFLSLSHNALHGRIPFSICYNASNLRGLDLSVNNFSGEIPHCLVKSETLRVLNLRKNILSGNVPDTFQASCALTTLDLSSNNLQGPIPKTLSLCITLEVLDIGNNKIDDEFPCLLKTIPTLRVMVLRGNNFHGPIGCPNMKMMIWEVLQIVDLAFNNFSGTLPGKFFTTWKAMMLDENQTAASKAHYIDQIMYGSRQINYTDWVKVTIKGHEMTLKKILRVFTSIDLSSNRIEGSIPEEMMDFTALHGLNLSNNNLSGHIPSSIWKLKQLESLDLSNNSVIGEIPPGLASLSFLSFLNLSCNHLEGKIPTGTQLQSFDASSFQGNAGLYGPPFTQSPNNGTQGLMPPPTSANHHAIDFGFIMGLEFGVVFGLGIIIGPLFFWRTWRIRYWKCVDFILCSIFPQIFVDYQRREGQWIQVLRWSH